MNIKSFGLVAGPIMQMVKNMVPHEAPSNSSGVFVKDIIDLFFPETDDPMLASVEEVVTDMAVAATNRDPDTFKDRLGMLNLKIERFLDREAEG